MIMSNTFHKNFYISTRSIQVIKDTKKDIITEVSCKRCKCTAPITHLMFMCPHHNKCRHKLIQLLFEKLHPLKQPFDTNNPLQYVQGLCTHIFNQGKDKPNTFKATPEFIINNFMENFQLTRMMCGIFRPSESYSISRYIKPKEDGAAERYQEIQMILWKQTWSCIMGSCQKQR